MASEWGVSTLFAFAARSDGRVCLDARRASDCVCRLGSVNLDTVLASDCCLRSRLDRYNAMSDRVTVGTGGYSSIPVI